MRKVGTLEVYWVDGCEPCNILEEVGRRYVVCDVRLSQSEKIENRRYVKKKRVKTH